MFFKKKRSASDIGIDLVKFIYPEESLVDGLTELTEEKHRKLSDEIFCLHIFTILFVVKLTLTDTNTTMAVIGSFFETIKKSRDFDANEVLGGSKNRYAVYEQAFYTPHHNGPLWTIGKQFSEFCDCGMDLDVIMMGSIIFVAKYESASKFIKSYKISCA